jgi:hypothetical protein
MTGVIRTGHMIAMNLVAAVLVLSGCDFTGAGYNFDIHAVYSAPKSGLIMEIDALGHVQSGDDISENGWGEVRIRSSTGQMNHVTLAFRSDIDGGYRCEVNSKTVVPWNFREKQNTFTAAVVGTGFSDPDPVEVAELVRAIDGALGGPKSLIMKGQSTTIDVVSTRHERKKAD